MALLPAGGLGFALGAARGYNEEVQRNKEIVAQLNAAKREWLFKTGMSRLENLRKQRDEKLARISQATVYGFDEKAARVLEASGELSVVLTRLEKLREDPEKDISTSAIRKMSQAILDNVPEEDLAKAVNYAFDINAAEDFNAEKLIDIVFSTTDEASLDKGRDMVLNIPSSPGGERISPTGVNLIGLTELSPEKTKQARQLIEDRLKDSLGRTLTDNGYVWDNPAAAGVIIDKALDYYITQRSDPYLDRDLADVTTDISRSVQELIDGGAQLEDIADQYEFGVPPSQFEFKTSNNSVVPPSVEMDTTLAPSTSEDYTLDIIEQNYGGN